MPKPTFFNLPTDKKETLIDAAMKEFSRVPLFEASISNIIKEAGIPRGSFYQYFEDKEDVFYFLLEEYSKRMNEEFIAILKKFDGDLMDTFIEYFQMLLKNMADLEIRRFFRNAFLNMNYKVENTLTQHVTEEKLNSRFSEVMNLVNTNKLNITEDRELFHMIKILKAVTTQNLIQVFAKDLPPEESIKQYNAEIQLLKKGFYKE